jgi:hypothetical protein
MTLLPPSPRESPMRAPLLLPLLLALAACAAPRPPAPVAVAPVADSAPAVVATSTTNGVTQITGSAASPLEAGTLLRLYDPAPGGRMKGMAVITGWSAGQFTARLTGLTDKTRQIATGDRAVPGEPDAAPVAAAVPPEALRVAALERQLAEREAEAVRTDRALAELHARATTPPAPTAQGTGLGDELARIEAERAYFDLCVRVLALPPDEPGVLALQAQIRHSLASRADLAAPAAPQSGAAHGH